jgi:hypothetical protein
MIELPIDCCIWNAVLIPQFARLTICRIEKRVNFHRIVTQESKVVIIEEFPELDVCIVNNNQLFWDQSNGACDEIGHAFGMSFTDFERIKEIFSTVICEEMICRADMSGWKVFPDVS